MTSISKVKRQQQQQQPEGGRAQDDSLVDALRPEARTPRYTTRPSICQPQKEGESTTNAVPSKGRVVGSQRLKHPSDVRRFHFQYSEERVNEQLRNDCCNDEETNTEGSAEEDFECATKSSPRSPHNRTSPAKGQHHINDLESKMHPRSRWEEKAPKGWRRPPLPKASEDKSTNACRTALILRTDSDVDDQFDQSERNIFSASDQGAETYDRDSEKTLQRRYIKSKTDHRKPRKPSDGQSTDPMALKIQSNHGRNQGTSIARDYSSGSSSSLPTPPPSVDSGSAIAVPRHGVVPSEIGDQRKDVWERVEKLKLSQHLRRNNARIVNEIIQYMADNLGASPWTQCKTGSYYEHTKIQKPNEYDCILACRLGSRRNFDLIYDKELQMKQTKAFCSLKLKSKRVVRKLSRLFTLPTECELCSRRCDIGGCDIEGCDLYLSPKSFRHFFRKRIEILTREERLRQYNINVTADDGLSPAVTIDVHHEKAGQFSIDLVPAIPINEWPASAIDWNCKSRERKTSSIKESETPNVHAIPKIHPSEYSKMEDECVLFRLSFSKAEKSLMLHADGTDKEEKSQKTCRKPVLLLLKEDLEEFNGKLPTDERCICSYFLKTIVFHLIDEISDESQWTTKYLRERYVNALQRLVDGLEVKTIYHYFIKGENLLELKSISDKHLSDVKKHFLQKLQLYKFKPWPFVSTKT